MFQTFTMKDKIKQILIMLIPILITQLGMFSMMVFSTIMSGKYNPADVAGVAIGASIWNPIFTGLSGILFAVSPIVAQQYGEKREKDISSIVSHGIYMALLLSVVVLVLGYFLLDPILNSMDLPASVHETAYDYLVSLGFGIIPLFIFNVLRSFIYGLGKTRVVMIILLLVLPINFFFNYVLIFGNWGFPELGGAGAGYATTITYWVIAAITTYIIITQRPFSPYLAMANFKEISWFRCKEILKIGGPMGLAIFFETGIFALVTILISKYDINTIAAYQSALNLTAFIYMIPLSISMAQTVLVGYEVGSGRFKDAKAYSWLGIYLSILIAAVTGILVVLFRFDVAGFYSNETAVINLISQFLIYAFVFQICDAIQVTALGALRGYQDVVIPFVMALIGYWLICLPVGYLLATFTNFGATGYWVGLTVGLLAVGVTLSIRLSHIQKKIINSAIMKENGIA